MKAVHVTRYGIHHIIPVQMVKTGDIPEEIVFIQQPGQLVTLCIPYQITVFRQFNAFGDTRLDDLDVRIRFRNEIHSAEVQAFHFRSKPIIQALQNAKKRGVDVRLIVDAEDAARSNSRARDAAAKGVPVFTDASHGTAHNKVTIVDGKIVITGSYNYTDKAETRNSENLLVIRSKDLASQYEREWGKHFSHSKPFK